MTSISSGVSQPPRSSPSSVHSKSSSSAGVKSSVPENSKMLMKFGVDEPSGGPLVMSGRRRRHVGPDDLPLVDRGRQVDPAELVDRLDEELVVALASSGPTVSGDSQKKYGSPSIEHWVIAFGWSAQNSNVAEPLVEVGRPSGPSGPSGPDRIEVSGAIPDEAARDREEREALGSCCRRAPAWTNGLFSVVMSSQSSPSKWSRRSDLVAAEVGRVVGEADGDRLGVLRRRRDVVDRALPPP